MIPKKPDNILETNIEGKKTFKFRFEADRHLFDAFSKNLYANPADSVVREVISNAVDANARVGKSFDDLTIILNNSEFIVQDKGNGITSKHMEEVVGVYGKSDKRDTNNEIGMYGFGFKSPFAVADQFIVETVPGDGYKYIWVIYKDLSGSGEIKLTSQVETRERPGTKIRIPVSQYLFNQIKTAVIKYIGFMNPQPASHIAGNIIMRRTESDKEGDNWILIKGQYTGFNVLYDGWMPYNCGIKTPQRLLIKMHKGEMDLSPSREQIKITEDFKKLFSDRCEEFWDETTKSLHDSVLKETDPIEILRMMNENYELHYANFNKYNAVEIKKHPLYGDLYFPISHVDDVSVTRYEHTRYRFYKRFSTTNVSSVATKSEPVFLYVNDEEVDKCRTPYYSSKYKALLSRNYSTLGIVLKSNLNNGCKIIQAVLAKAIDIKSVKVIRSGSSGGNHIKYKKGHIIAKDVSGNRLELPINSGEYVYTTNKWEVGGYDALSKLNGIQLCHINKRSVKRVKDLPNWKTPVEYITGFVKNVDKQAIEDVAFNRGLDYTNKVIKAVAAEKKISIKKEEAEIVKMAINHGILSTKIDKEIDKIESEYYKKYPLLKDINTYDASIPRIKEYIKIVDFYEQHKSKINGE